MLFRHYDTVMSLSRHTLLLLRHKLLFSNDPYRLPYIGAICHINLLFDWVWNIEKYVFYIIMQCTVVYAAEGQSCINLFKDIFDHPFSTLLYFFGRPFVFKSNVTKKSGLFIKCKNQTINVQTHARQTIWLFRKKKLIWEHLFHFSSFISGARTYRF